jgi:hypothetical protein
LTFETISVNNQAAGDHKHLRYNLVRVIRFHLEPVGEKGQKGSRQAQITAFDEAFRDLQMNYPGAGCLPLRYFPETTTSTLIFSASVPAR